MKKNSSQYTFMDAGWSTVDGKHEQILWIPLCNDRAYRVWLSVHATSVVGALDWRMPYVTARNCSALIGR
jgi:hypothetical protein